jgi:hypothetical protein
MASENEFRSVKRQMLYQLIDVDENISGRTENIAD